MGGIREREKQKKEEKTPLAVLMRVEGAGYFCRCKRGLNFMFRSRFRVHFDDLYARITN